MKLCRKVLTEKNDELIFENRVIKFHIKNGGGALETWVKARKINLSERYLSHPLPNHLC